MWSGAAVATVLTGSIGLAAALAPNVWLGLFSQDPDVLAAGRTYLAHRRPRLRLLRARPLLYFASQGLGRLGWPLIAGFARLSVATVGGFIVVHWLGGGLPGLFCDHHAGARRVRDHGRRRPVEERTMTTSRPMIGSVLAAWFLIVLVAGYAGRVRRRAGSAAARDPDRHRRSVDALRRLLSQPRRPSSASCSASICDGSPPCRAGA